MSKRNAPSASARSRQQIAGEIAKKFLPMIDNQSMLMTLNVGELELSTAVDTDADGNITVEIPDVIVSAFQAWIFGHNLAVITRSFDIGTIARHAPNGYPIPYKTVRGWILLSGAEPEPLSASKIREAYSIHAVTGEPIEPDSSEIFADAWELTDKPGGE
jgi:hypothetical protein